MGRAMVNARGARLYCPMVQATRPVVNTMAVKSAASKGRPLARDAKPRRVAVRTEIRVVFMASVG